MLGKLLKHEWKVVWKVPMLLIGILMIMAMVAGFTFVLPVWGSEWVGLPLSGMMLIMLFYFSMIAVSVGITIYFAVRYYKNMFTDEGYLTHTLPVSARQLLLNKVITMSAWNLISLIAVGLSLVLFAGITLWALTPKDSSFAREVIETFAELMEEWPELIRSPYMRGFTGFCMSILFMILAGSFSGTMMVIGSISLGQMVRKHRILGAIGAYFAINTVVQMVNMIIIFPVMFGFQNTMSRWDMDVSPFPVFTRFYGILTAVTLAVAVGLYFLSEYLIRRQLELE